MEHAEALLLRTLGDLDHRIISTDPYEILGASSLIRKLLLDEHPLVDQVNRHFRLKVLFEVAAPIPLPPGGPNPVFETVQDGLDPDSAPPWLPRKSLRRDEFLAYELAKVGDHSYTVREVVQFEANVMGGVHAGSPRDAKQAALRQVEETLSVGGLPSSLRQLRAVGRVVLKALSPLREAVQRKYEV